MRRWITIIFELAALALISINLVNKNKAQPEIINTDTPTYKGNHINMVVYDQKGSLNYRITSQHVEVFSEKKVSWFTRPVMTAFDVNKTPTWLIKSDKAKLKNDHILYLYGHVEIDIITPNIQLRKITTNNAQINLISQDITSQDLVTLHGATFNSNGLRMYGNLRSKNAELIEEVKTLYEIQNKATQP